MPAIVVGDFDRNARLSRGAPYAQKTMKSVYTVIARGSETKSEQAHPSLFRGHGL